MFLLYHNLLFMHFKEICVQHDANNTCGGCSAAYTFHVACNVTCNDQVMLTDCEKPHPTVRDGIYLRHNRVLNKLG